MGKNSSPWLSLPPVLACLADVTVTLVCQDPDYWRGRYERDREDAETSAPRGLGLTIARQAVETQGGRLTVTSSPGEGATFLVWLPMSGDAEAAAVVAPDGVHPLADPLSAALPANAQPALTAPLTLHP